MINKLIIDNYNFSVNTFAYMYKYKQNVDSELLNELLNIIAKEALTTDHDNRIEIIKYIFSIYSSFTLCTILFLNNHPIERFDNFNDFDFEYMYRFRNIINLVLSDDKKGLLNYEDDLGKLEL